MPYCKNCGTKLPEGVAYCPKCGTSVETAVKLALAGWGERFVAWLIDIIILGIILAPAKLLLVWVAWPSFIWTPNFLRWIPFVNFGLDNLIYFLYWMLMEGIYSQSLGKMIMKIEVTQLNGKPANIVHSAIESIGKAFLLPIDCIIGWILYPTRKQRLFNYISGTIVVRTFR